MAKTIQFDDATPVYTVKSSRGLPERPRDSFRPHTPVVSAISAVLCHHLLQSTTARTHT